MGAFDKALLTYHEAAELLSVSHWTVRQMVRDGRLSVAGNGRGRRVTMGSVRRLGQLDVAMPTPNPLRAPGVSRRKACHTNAPARHTGGPATSNAARELDALLVRQT
ncbi:MAG: helix-turn-helix domain-containing protein [Pseudomonadota bacterium]